MDCRRAERLISNRLDSPLNERDERELEFHLAACRRCRDSAASFTTLGESATSLVGVEPNRNLAAAAVDRYRALRPSYRPIAWAFGAAAGVILAAGFIWNLSPENPTRIARESTAPVRSAAVVKKQANSPVKREVAPAIDRRRVPLPSPGPKTVIAATPKPRLPIDDLAYINEDPSTAILRWSAIPPDELSRLQAQFERIARTGDDFVQVTIPRIASVDGRSAIAAALVAYQRETAVVDARLARKMTLAVKGESFEELCGRIRQETGIDISAGRSVADDKVTLFCRDKPLRDIMRQVTRVFGFQWRRTGEAGAYVYELIQDLKSQLLEEELRNRDRNEALIALDNEMEKLRDILKLGPDELRKRAESAASPEEKQKYESLAIGWGAGQLYFNLGPDQMAALRNGEYLQFSSAPSPGMQELPPGLTSGILSSLGNLRIDTGSGIRIGPASSVPNGAAPSATPGAFAQAGIEVDRSDLGQFRMLGMAGVGVDTGGNRARHNTKVPIATGESPSVKDPQNATVNAKLASEPALKARVNIVPSPSNRFEREKDGPALAPLGLPMEPIGPVATTADVLEAIHKVSGADVIGDYFTRLYSPDAVTARNVTLFEGLNKLSDKARLKWAREGGWLQFRSTGFFNDRRKEIPNRLLARWAAKRAEQGHLGPYEAGEIASLTDDQLNAPANARAARAFYGLLDWDIARSTQVRPHWRYFAGLSEQAKKAVLSQKGIGLGQLAPSQQQRFVSTVLAARNDMGLTLGQITAANMQLSFDPKPPPAPVEENGNRELVSPVRFTYRIPEEEGNELVWIIEPYRNSFNSSGTRAESRVVR